jgi:hypothetical protein
MQSKLWMCVILAYTAMPTAAAGAKLAGKVLDAAALSQVKTYCIDTINLRGAIYPGDVRGAQEFDVRELVTRESRAKGLLSKLPWKLEADCSAPGVDAVVRFEFHVIRAPAPLNPMLNSPNIAARPQRREVGWRAELQVTDKASSGAVYEAEGNPVDVSLVRPKEQRFGPLDQPPPSVDVRAQRFHVLRQDAAYHALAALVSDVKTISKNP